MLSERPSNESLNTAMTSFFPRNTPVDLAEMHCKNYYKIFNEKCTIEPTGIKNWKIKFPDVFFFADWKNNFLFISQSTKDNKLRQFSFKLLHRITVTKKELCKFRLSNDGLCNFCKIVTP